MSVDQGDCFVTRLHEAYTSQQSAVTAVGLSPSSARGMRLAIFLQQLQTTSYIPWFIRSHISAIPHAAFLCSRIFQSRFFDFRIFSVPKRKIPWCRFRLLMAVYISPELLQFDFEVRDTAVPGSQRQKMFYLECWNRVNILQAGCSYWRLSNIKTLKATIPYTVVKIR